MLLFSNERDSIALALCYQRASVQMAAIRTAGEAEALIERRPRVNREDPRWIS